MVGLVADGAVLRPGDVPSDGGTPVVIQYELSVRAEDLKVLRAAKILVVRHSGFGTDVPLRVELLTEHMTAPPQRGGVYVSRTSLGEKTGQVLIEASLKLVGQAAGRP